MTAVWVTSLAFTAVQVTLRSAVKTWDGMKAALEARVRDECARCGKDERVLIVASNRALFCAVASLLKGTLCQSKKYPFV
jgi:hypothetical protein